MKLIILLFFVVFSLQIQCKWATNPNVSNAICTASGDQFLPRIVSDKYGGAIITWEEFRNGNNYNIYAQRINNSGIVLLSLNGVAITAVTKDQTMRELISDGSGGAIITWTDFRSGNYSDIYAQQVTCDSQVGKVFDMLGREIETIVDGYYKVGNHSTLYIPNSTLSSGVYFYQLKADGYVQIMKMIFLK